MTVLWRTRADPGANDQAGVASHLSAAQLHGWPVKTVPDKPWVTVRRKRRLDADVRALVHVAYVDLRDDEAADGVTTPLRRQVAAHATPLAANPFESVLRALVLEVGVLDVVPQHPYAGGWWSRPTRGSSTPGATSTAGTASATPR